MISSYIQGHKVEYVNGKWRYCDNKEDISNIRPCKKCGKEAILEGYDACLGYLSGIKSACCGHGVTVPILVLSNGTNL